MIHDMESKHSKVSPKERCNDNGSDDQSDDINEFDEWQSSDSDDDQHFGSNRRDRSPPPTPPTPTILGNGSQQRNRYRRPSVVFGHRISRIAPTSIKCDNGVNQMVTIRSTLQRASRASPSPPPPPELSLSPRVGSPVSSSAPPTIANITPTPLSLSPIGAITNDIDDAESPSW
jgi:hypothetical protein